MPTTTTTTPKMPVLPEDFNVKILPIKELEGVQAKKSSLAFEDLQALAANSDVGSITLKQLKNRIPTGARFCNEESEEVSESWTLQTFVRYSAQNIKALKDAEDGIKSIKIWYLALTKQSSSGSPLVPLQDIMPQRSTPKYGSNEPLQKPTLLDATEQKGKMNQQSIQELLQQVGADPATISQELSKDGLQDLKALEWKAIQDKLKYLHGYKPNIESNRFLKVSIPAFKTFRVLDDVVPRKPIPSESEDPESEGNDSEAQKSKAVEPNEVIDGHIVERIIPNYGAQSGGHMEINSYSSISEMQYAFNGFSHKNSQIALGLASPKVSAGVSAEHEKFTEQESKRGEITMESRIVATWTHPVVEIIVDSHSAEIHPKCKERMDALIKEGTYELAEKFLEDFGTTFSTRIMCGGKLKTEVTRKSESVETYDSQVDKFRHAVDANIQASFMGGLVGGKISGGHTAESASGSTSSGKSLTESTSLTWTALGGEDVFAQLPMQWLSSVANFNHWEIIEHIELKPMIDAFDDFEGYENFSAIMRALLSPGRYLSVYRLPWLPSMNGKFGLPPKEVSAVGYSFSSNPSFIVKPQMPAFRVDRKDIIRNAGDSGQGTHTWMLVKDHGSIVRLINDHMPWNRQAQGALPLPDFVHQLSASEKSFTVILSHMGKEIISEVSPTQLRWDETAIRLANDKNTEKSAFEAQYGDKFITGFSTQRSIYAVFRFYFDKISDLNIASGKFATELALKNIADGCDWIKDLLSRPGVQGDALVFTSDCPSGGFVEKTWIRIHPQDMGTVKDKISNVKNGDEVAVELITRSFAELLPHLEFPQQNTFTSNDADAKIRARFDLIKYYADTVARTRTPLFRDGVQRTDQLHRQLGNLATSFKDIERSMSGFGYSSEQVSTLTGQVDSARFDIDCQLAACQWIRNSLFKEIDLWKKDIPWGQRFKQHTAEFDWAPQEADRHQWGNKIVDHINSRIQRPADQHLDYEWSILSTPKDVSILEVKAPETCCLVGYKMLSNNGSVCGGGRWFPASHNPGVLNITIDCMNEDDLFVWRRNPKIAHFRDQLYSHHWTLKSWWLSEDEFPFHKDRLYDFEMDGFDHKKGTKAYA